MELRRDKIPRLIRKFFEVITYYYVMYLHYHVILFLVVNIEDDLDPDFIPITVNYEGTKCFIHA